MDSSSMRNETPELGVFLKRYQDLVKLFANFGKEEKVRVHMDMILKAHGDGKFDIDEIISSQREYQNWLFLELHENRAMIMEFHRSIGFEFEFATYDSSKDFPSHTIIAKSEPFSNLFNSSFLLETDTHNELEIGIPPFLILNKDGRIRKRTIRRLWMLFKKRMQLFNLEYHEQNMQSLTNAFQKNGLGDEWSLKLANQDIHIVKRVKHREKKDQVYSQLNISLTAEEIAFYIINFGIKEYNSERYEYFKTLYTQLNAVINPHLKTSSQRCFSIHLCKGLSHLLAIPSLLLLKKLPENSQNERAVYSSVKEVFGIWVKDSLINVLDNCLINENERKEIKQLILKQKKEMDAVMKEFVEKAFFIIKHISMANEVYMKIAFTEYETTLKKIIQRLDQLRPVQKKVRCTELYKSESFPSNGDGVRKETFVNIYSSETNCFHLAELRSDQQIQMFLSY